MRLSPQTLSANGDSLWVVPIPLLKSPVLGLALTFSADANLTAAVQYTYDDTSQTPVAVSMARSGTTLTVTQANHGLTTNDAAELSQGVAGLWNGSYDVTVVDKNTYTVAVANSGATSDTGVARTYKLFTHPTLAAITGVPPTRIDGTINWPIGAFRLHVSAWSAGSATLSSQMGAGN